MGSQTVVVPSGVTTNWAECRGDDTAAGAVLGGVGAIRAVYANSANATITHAIALN